jgi:TolB-like protein/Tfp pilus assembly protein PilF
MAARRSRRVTPPRIVLPTVRTPFLVAGFIALASARDLRAQCADGSPPPCRAAARPAAAPPAASVAVLSFANAAGDSSAAFLASGIADAITARLSGVRRLTVASRAAVARVRDAAAMRTADIGRALGVTFLVSGTLRQVDGRLSVTAELVRAATGQQIWARQFDQPRAELLAIQGTIAQEVAAAILGPLRQEEQDVLAARPTRDPRAFELFLGTNGALWNADPVVLQRAVGSLENALRLDPSFTDATGRIAFLYGFAFNWNMAIPGMSPESLLTRGLAYANQALAADSNSVEAWNALTFALFFREPPDYAGALAAARRGLAIDSSDANIRANYATILRRLGDFASAQEEYRRVSAINPGVFQAVADQGFIAITLRRFPEARVLYDSALAIRDAWQNQFYAARTRLLVGDTAGARRAIARALDQVPLASRSLVLAAQAQVDARLGDTAAARATVEPLVAALGAEGPLGMREGTEIALALVALGERGRALDLLERVRPRSAWLWSYLILPWYDPIRADPRFQRLVREAAPPGAPRM